MEVARIKTWAVAMVRIGPVARVKKISPRPLRGGGGKSPKFPISPKI